MNFLSIEYFAAVASEHSFSKAAKRLGITQQTLSANIAALERELGCTLFVRHVPLELTYAGTVFARYAQRFRRDRDALGQEMRDIAGDRAGVLRVGVAYTRSRAIMPPIVKAMQRDCPNIIVELIEGRNDQIQQWLANGDLDLAVADFAGKPAGIELMDFYNERMVLVLAQSLWMDLAATGGAANGQVDAVRTAPDERAIAAGDLSSLEHCPFLLGSPQDIDGRIADLLFRRAGFEPKVTARSPAYARSGSCQRCLTANGCAPCVCWIAGRRPNTPSDSAFRPHHTAGASLMISFVAHARSPPACRNSRQLAFKWG